MVNNGEDLETTTKVRDGLPEEETKRAIGLSEIATATECLETALDKPSRSGKSMVRRYAIAESNLSSDGDGRDVDDSVDTT